MATARGCGSHAADNVRTWGAAAMELKWLDDYIALIETGSFSAAAARRHVSQPAFSRRIQMLEDWLGVTLIDRTRKPLQFTAVAKDNQLGFRSLVARIYEFRAVLKSESLDSAGITIAAQHTLAAAYVPGFLARLRHLDPDQNFRIRSENRADSVAMLMRGEAEILITYDTPQSPCNVPEQLARRHVLGQDDLMLVACPALHKDLSKTAEGGRVPMLCFPPDSFFGQVVRAEVLPELMRRQQVVVRCVSEFAMALRELALVGQGAAWLPASLIQDDLARKSLLPLGRLGHSVRMDIVVFFAVLPGDRGDNLQRSFELLRGDSTRPPGAAVDRARRLPRGKRPSARAARRQDRA
ncbi:MAG: LysR family transcriptional regulator [Proteobacteria bacterium]|jgi:LysR family transcriptional regulator, hypochlorite-specific transcription factor HypT|nr:LysR family transcriptional regulator [Pseudomonadota bacterium]